MNYIQTKKKMEINNRAEEIGLPFSVACKVCRNSLHDICLEDCAVYRDFKYFEPRKDMNALDLPRFTMEVYKELPGKIKGELLAFYVIKLMEALYVSDR